MLATQVKYGKIDLTYALNGAIAGLVLHHGWTRSSKPLLAVLIGAVGGILVVVTVPILDRLKIDDVVGAIPAHLVAGIWGTLCVGIFGSGNFGFQLTGIIAIGVFVFVVSFVIWFILKSTMGIRASDEAQNKDLIHLRWV